MLAVVNVLSWVGEHGDMFASEAFCLAARGPTGQFVPSPCMRVDALTAALCARHIRRVASQTAD